MKVPTLTPLELSLRNQAVTPSLAPTKMYDKAMTVYFGMYAATMTANASFFWGPESPLMLPYMSKPMPAGTAGAFFSRMTGLCFGIMALTYVFFGAPKDVWIKTTLAFHILSTPIFILDCCLSDGSMFTPWVWWVQVGMNATLALWGLSALGGSKGKGKKK